MDVDYGIYTIGDSNSSTESEHAQCLRFFNAFEELLSPHVESSFSSRNIINDFAAASLRLMDMPLHLQEVCVGYLEQHESVETIESWLLILEAAYLSGDSGTAFLRSFYPSDIPTDSWFHLGEQLEMDTLISIAKTLGNHRQMNLEEEWDTLRHHLACVLIDRSSTLIESYGGELEAFLLPSNAHIEKVAEICKRLNAIESSSQNIGELVDAMVADAIDDLTEDREVEAACPEAQHAIWQAADGLTLGLCLLLPHGVCPDDVTSPQAPLRLSIVDIVGLLGYAVGLDSFVTNPEQLTKFAAYYLLDGRGNDLEDDFNGGLFTLKSWIQFRNIYRAACAVDGFSWDQFLSQMDKGILCLCTRVLSSRNTCQTVWQRELLASLYEKISNYQVNRVIAENEQQPVPLSLGWTIPDGAHAIWAIVHENVVELFNSGRGINHHEQRPSPRGEGLQFSIKKQGPKFTTDELKVYLKDVLRLRQEYRSTVPGKRQRSSQYKALESLVISKHYDPLRSENRATDSAEIFAHAQRSITCSVKVLKYMARTCCPDRHRFMHVTGKMLAYATYHRRITETSRETEFKVEMRQTIAKEIFRILVDKGAELETLSKLAWHFSTDDNWLWDSPVMIRQVYNQALHAQRYEIAEEWLRYQLDQRAALTSQLVADLFNEHQNGSVPREFCVGALADVSRSHKDLTSFYSRALKRANGNIQRFDWAWVARTKPRLLKVLCREMQTDPACAKFREQLTSIASHT